MNKPVTASALRAAAELAAKLGVTIRIERDAVIVMPKDAAQDDPFDLVPMKRK